MTNSMTQYTADDVTITDGRSMGETGTRERLARVGGQTFHIRAFIGGPQHVTFISRSGVLLQTLVWSPNQNWRHDMAAAVAALANG